MNEHPDIEHLLHAIQMGDLEQVKACHAQASDPYLFIEAPSFLFHWTDAINATLMAAYCGRWSVLEWLLTQPGADVHVKDGKGDNALAFLLHGWPDGVGRDKTHVECVSRLTSLPGGPLMLMEKNKAGLTVLMMAIEGHPQNTVKAFMPFYMALTPWENKFEALEHCLLGGNSTGLAFLLEHCHEHGNVRLEDLEALIETSKDDAVNGRVTETSIDVLTKFKALKERDTLGRLVNVQPQAPLSRARFGV